MGRAKQLGLESRPQILVPILGVTWSKMTSRKRLHPDDSEEEAEDYPSFYKGDDGLFYDDDDDEEDHDDDGPPRKKVKASHVHTIFSSIHDDIKDFICNILCSVR